MSLKLAFLPSSSQVNIFNTTTTNSPKADGLNAMQSWVICCIFFVFGALFEYAVILLQMKAGPIKAHISNISLI